MKTSYENRYAEHPDDVKSYDTKNIRCDFLIEKAFSQDKVSIEYKLLANRT
ncbi:5-keto-4-deoxyuronate isomerase [uncultured Bacteroides sp.]|jgi:4-deoxy-L-threo-5-hexosulose-uronate ketol-isomerase|uniref:5-keto-4-deoxyuronate isomerase n=1 Tax=Bacteroides muris (ex Afrizal et al. 2022) TaxID=2516960 RepID=A0A4S2B450_9BACE|nr:5-keto-4-deoxyuronate isomerase [Bacteroides sp. L10-4]TGY08907.1 5-keto-4-deoxyuronate isomerase [Bacteroides muris (ex Afrizal et al. 2022)]